MRKITFKEIEEAIENYNLIKIIESEFYGTPDINEAGAGLSRVLKVLDDNIDFLFITASRGSKSRKENKANNNKLIKDIRAEVGKKIGAYKIVGHWKECSTELKDGQTLKDCNGTIENALEETWLITRPDDVSPEEFNSLAQKISKKYEQDAYVIRINGKLTLNGKDGSEWADLGKANKDSLSTGFDKIVNVQGYSELAKLRKKGRSANIVFENLYVMKPKDNIASKLLFVESNILF